MLPSRSPRRRTICPMCRHTARNPVRAMKITGCQSQLQILNAKSAAGVFSFPSLSKDCSEVAQKNSQCSPQSKNFWVSRSLPFLKPSIEILRS